MGAQLASEEDGTCRSSGGGTADEEIRGDSGDPQGSIFPSKCFTERDIANLINFECERARAEKIEKMSMVFPRKPLEGEDDDDYTALFDRPSRADELLSWWVRVDKSTGT
eukprot:CAMPEP_0170197486 /NCGR_PEP_ID=MMETSP0040_2-20121228/66518_1 /TAXON_ID=641309 /ORGANISM="Lotharella oceanica, Strain CCMP622" /LENGTH=109 /DNA_ID=CAMNT_0010447173 /DNA_START=1 /DNA_END=330 /DNA_ORIENTATION=-